MLLSTGQLKGDNICDRDEAQDNPVNFILLFCFVFVFFKDYSFHVGIGLCFIQLINHD